VCWHRLRLCSSIKVQHRVSYVVKGSRYSNLNYLYCSRIYFVLLKLWQVFWASVCHRSTWAHCTRALCGS
jgi:hypothetical protein